MAYRGSVFSIIVGVVIVGWIHSTISDELLSNISLVFGIITLIAGTISLIVDIKKEQKKKSALRPMCDYCGYVALDERELHNHHITCEKRKNPNSC